MHFISTKLDPHEGISAFSVCMQRASSLQNFIRYPKKGNSKSQVLLWVVYKNLSDSRRRWSRFGSYLSGDVCEMRAPKDVILVTITVHTPRERESVAFASSIHTSDIRRKDSQCQLLLWVTYKHLSDPRRRWWRFGSYLSGISPIS
jgi:hypothetical protein